jgi:aminoglycoside phosphotransferase (APT) family kinase protein
VSTNVQPPTTAQVRSAFGVEVGALKPHPSGFEADAFTDGQWFVKLWRYEPDSDGALALTADLADRGLPVPAAQQTLDGVYTAEHDGRRYALFPFVDGHQATSEKDIDAIARAMRGLHEIRDLDLPLPRTDLDEWCIEALRDRQDHPWLGDRREEVLTSVDRLEAVIEKARTVEVPLVVCHHDLFPHNVLVDRDGRIAALLDWGHTMFAPREHDLFAALCEEETVRFLQAYGAQGLDITHLEYARLARSVRDLAARVVNEVDQDGLNTWGFDGLRRVDADLALARPFCDS